MTVSGERPYGGLEMRFLDENVIGIVRGDRKYWNACIREGIGKRSHDAGQRRIERTFTSQNAPALLARDSRRNVGFETHDGEFVRRSGNRNEGAFIGPGGNDVAGREPRN